MRSHFTLSVNYDARMSSVVGNPVWTPDRFSRTKLALHPGHKRGSEPSSAGRRWAVRLLAWSRCGRARVLVPSRPLLCGLIVYLAAAVA